ncbi:SAM-dependent methyltransferase [Pseudoclavibacter sp. RFBG4]|uniref:class I SAM-dependent methyltransferase n=1 Tax=Pseudoclavibacter sp. RFBG4 TaxID=2080575 RepID=UPI000CE8A6D9|nr:class I SAM-dependent methyltransferase [Pseudoclavibacter sp. RFBG4]PPG27852.1 SAM-dependent methyltransferase [Pseudoclavibacter sp. RFBG4]
MPLGRLTRGTTGTNRLRRVDRWIAAHPALRSAQRPLVVDLGYGASGATAFELAGRLRGAAPEVRVHGLEIDPGRVALARAQLGDRPELAGRVSFAVGGFEVPTPGGEQPSVIRAMNVLRQYDESEVAEAWARMTGRLAPRGLLVEGTCNEVGRVSSWIGVDAAGPRTFTVSLHTASLESPLVVAERLPKALIHRNVPGEGVHEYLKALDDAWQREAPRQTFGARQRFIAVCERMRAAGWPLVDSRKRWRLGEITVSWDAVAPASGALSPS